MLVQSEIQRLKVVKDFVRMPYAWPGGYPLVMVTSDGGALCSDCAHAEWPLICAESFDNTNCGFRTSGVGANYENDNLYCDHCNAHIPSAYGDSE